MTTLTTLRSAVSGQVGQVVGKVKHPGDHGTLNQLEVPDTDLLRELLPDVNTKQGAPHHPQLACGRTCPGGLSNKEEEDGQPVLLDRASGAGARPASMDRNSLLLANKKCDRCDHYPDYF
eukprot:gene3319-3821_t